MKEGSDGDRESGETEGDAGEGASRAGVRVEVGTGAGAVAGSTRTGGMGNDDGSAGPPGATAHINVSPVVASTAAEESGGRTVESEIDALQLGL